MQVHSLELDDFSNNDYTLIGIHTALENYRLAYLLNKHLSVQFSRASYKLDFENNNASFIVYEFLNKKLEVFWHLIANTFKEETEYAKTGLFTRSYSSTYLIPEKKKIDFFLKLEGSFDDYFILTLIKKINQINQIITSYTIDVNKLKSKEFLIF